MRFLGPGCGFQAQLEAGTEGKRTALHVAAINGHAAVATKLLNAKALVDAADAGGDTPLHNAAYYGHAAVAELLLATNAGPTAVNQFGTTPADLGKQRLCPELAKRLREWPQGAASK